MRLIATLLALLFSNLLATSLQAQSPSRPNIVLVMADDQGWGETGYYGHPLLKTPHLDAMAAAGLRFDRYYAAAPVCSPTRASVLTGRTNMRAGVESHGYALRRQEKTLPAALQNAGYATAHFGKWHLNGMRGPGVPVLKDDTHHPGVFGFDKWLSVTNFFDRDPILSRQGEFEEFQGDSSEIVVEQALQFIKAQATAGRPSFTVIWFGTPHSPFRAAPEDAAAFAQLDENSREHYGELVALDRSIGTLRQGLREANIADNTLLWYTSDNGGLPKIKPATVGGLRGFKGSLYEGGIRVPGIIEWPARITTPRITQFPAVATDIFPTIADIVGLPPESMLSPCDGISLQGLFDKEIGPRTKPMVFSCLGNSAIIDGNMKLLQLGRKERLEMYDIDKDPHEENNLIALDAAGAEKMKGQMRDFLESLNQSIAGADYPSGKVRSDYPAPRQWTQVPAYRPFFEQWKHRPEYRSSLK